MNYTQSYLLFIYLYKNLELTPQYNVFCAGRYYTLIVGANERRWRRVRNKLKVVADSFKVLDI